MILSALSSVRPRTVNTYHVLCMWILNQVFVTKSATDLSANFIILIRLSVVRKMLRTTTREVTTRLEKKLLILFWIVFARSRTPVLDYKVSLSSMPLEVVQDP